MRHKNSYDIFDPEKYGSQKVVIIGAGGIGSTTAYLMAQMGFQNITIVDYDAVEDHNVASQFYKVSDLGKEKVRAILDNVLEFTGVQMSGIDGTFSPEMLDGAEIVIMAVDNMDARKQIADAATGAYMVIDGRMAGEYFEIFCFPPLAKDRYMKNWFPQSEATSVVCTEKSVSYNCACIASFITRMAKGAAKLETLPFHTVVDMGNYSAEIVEE